MTDRTRYADATASPGPSRPYAEPTLHDDQPLHAEPTLVAESPLHVEPTLHGDRPTGVAGVT